MRNRNFAAEIECALFSCQVKSRTCPEKRVAHALKKGGVTRVHLSESFWANSKKDVDGLMIHPNSIVTHGGEWVKYGPSFYGTTGLPVLWAIFQRLGIQYIGMADKEKGHAQACPTSLSSPSIVIPYVDLDLSLVVLYFDAMKDLPDYHWDVKGL